MKPSSVRRACFAAVAEGASIIMFHDSVREENFSMVHPAFAT